MALQHDAQGFLAGAPIDIGRALAIWEDIQKNVTAIKHALTAASSRQDSAGRGRPNASVLPSGRDRTGRSPALPGIRNAAALNENRPARATVRINRDGTPALPAGRDGRGRFTREAQSDDGPEQSSATPAADGSAIRNLADRLTGSINGAAGGLDEVDPAAKAFTEVAQPIARGYEMISGNRDEKRKEGWYRRIFGELKIFRKEEGLFAKLASRRLKGIDERPDSESGGSGGGMWATAIAAMLGIGPAIKAALGFLLSKIPFVGKLFKGAAGGAGGVPPAGGLAAGMGKFLKRIPLLGALIGGVGAATDIYSSENDDTLTRREKDKNAGKATGGFAGSMAGMAAGAALGAFGGPVGMAIGGMVGMFLGDQAGQIIGDTMGGWVNDLRGADIPGRIASAWDATTGAIKSGWDGAMTGFKSVQEGISKGWNGFVDTAKAGWATITGLFSAAYEGLKSIPIIGDAIKAVEDAAKKAAEAAKDIAAKTAKAASDAKQAVTEKANEAGTKAKEVVVAAKDKVVEVGAKAVGAAKQGAEWAGDNTTVGKGIKAAGEVVNYGTDVVVDAAKSTKARITGKASENKVALVNQMAASGISDPKEQAMFMAQMDHESGGFTKMEERFNYRSADRLMAVSGSARKLGKPAVEAAMAQGPEAVAESMYGGRMGNKSPGDAYAFRGRGHVQLTGRDNYTAAGKDLGLDLANNPDLAAEPENAAKIAAWYWKKNPKLGEAARRGDVKAVTQGINGGQNGYDHRNELFAQYSTAANNGDLTAGATVASKAGTTMAVAAAVPAVKKLAAIAPNPDTATAAAPVNPTKEAETKVASLNEDPSQGGRLEYKDLGGGDISVTDAESGITDIATAEQEKAYRIQKGREYKAQIAAVNDPNSYKPGGVHSGGKVALNAGPNMIMAPAAPAVASVPAPAISVAPASPAMAEAPPVVAPLASGDSKKSGTTSYANPDASQDLKDRRIAHIATGGFSA